MKSQTFEELLAATTEALEHAQGNKTLKSTEINFPCPYSLEEKYKMATSGEYGAFELYGKDGEISGYRGFRKTGGTTGVYDNYKDALEAAFTEFGDK